MLIVFGFDVNGSKILCLTLGLEIWVFVVLISHALEEIYLNGLIGQFVILRGISLHSTILFAIFIG